MYLFSALFIYQLTVLQKFIRLSIIKQITTIKISSIVVLFVLNKKTNSPITTAILSNKTIILTPLEWAIVAGSRARHMRWSGGFQLSPHTP